MNTTDQHKHTNRAWPVRAIALVPLLAVVLLGAQQTQAKEFEAGEDWTVRWDNTFKFNYGIRTEEPHEAVYLQNSGTSGALGATGILADDGDLGWDQWDNITARVDILSELDAVFKDGKFGFRVSAAGWYDYAYKDDSDFPAAHPGSADPAKDAIFSGTNTWSGITHGPGQLSEFR